jgi:hypothetical protein
MSVFRPLSFLLCTLSRLDLFSEAQSTNLKSQIADLKSQIKNHKCPFR